jgi:hypothetical protein
VCLFLGFNSYSNQVWKTCFIQIKHKEKEGKNKHEEIKGTIQHKEKEGTIINVSNVKDISGDFSLSKYFDSYCQIRSKDSTDQNMKHSDRFDDFEIVIYTNARMEINSALQGDDSDTLSILSSGTNGAKYITFGEAVDTKIFKFF